jgi:hypothetical protein
MTPSLTRTGNLLVVGSIANLIVIDQTRRIGVPVTLAALAIAALRLWLRA